MSEKTPEVPHVSRVAPGLHFGAGAWLTVLAVLAGGGLVMFLFLPVTRSAREPARSSTCKNNLKQIGLALHNYHDDFGGFPPACTVDNNGQPLHSWRTLLLPYLDGRSIYRKIDFSKPWNHPANAEAFKSTIPVYQCPSADHNSPQTTYLANAARQGCFRPSKPRTISDIKDGLDSTVMVIEVTPAHAVHWMSPEDADESLMMSLGAVTRQPHSRGTHALFCDGSVRPLPADLPATERRAQISIAAGDR